MNKYRVFVRRTRGRRKPRTRIGLRPVVVFVVLCVLTATAARWVESHFEPGERAAQTQNAAIR